MSYNNDINKKNSFEIDDMDIKSHLNTSLDLDGISVSEELLNRTLAAIKAQQTSSEDTKEKVTPSVQSDRKQIPWNRYTRRIAGVAAALLVVVVGYSLMKQMPMVGKKSASTEMAAPEYNLAMDTAAPAETADRAVEDAPAQADQATATADTGAQSVDDAMKYSLTAEAKNESSAKVGAAKSTSEAEEAAEAGEGTNDAVEDPETQMTSVPGSSEMDAQEFMATEGTSAVYSFRDIFIPAPEQAEYITITDNVGNKSITLTTLEDMQAFYLVMDNHQFTGIDTAADANQNYTVEMKQPDTQSMYILTIGASLKVLYTKGDITSEYVYMPDDMALLEKDLDAFLSEYLK